MLSVVSYDDMFMKFTQQFLQNFEEIASTNFQEGTYLDLEIKGRNNRKRINPIIRKATVKDIDEIIFIYKDIYDNTYPYKEMEDREEILKMIHSPNVEWLIFETKEHEVVGCFTFILDFENKLGNIRGFNLKKKFLGKLDIMKMAMGSIITMYKKYNDKIFRWYGECRTAHSKSQFFLSALGFKPVGFYPCKDVFYNKVESDLLILSYDQRALTTLRSGETPKIIPSVLNGYIYSMNRYKLVPCKIKNIDKITLNKRKIKKIEKAIEKNVKRDRFGYESIKFTIKNSDSYFEFLYTPTVQNFEKTHYKVDSMEELYVFVQEFLKSGKEYKIRYSEAFISAYKPSHQKLFLDFGLYPRGYVPSWKYNNKSGMFEDCILFNCFKGKVSKDIKLLQEGQDLVEMVGSYYSYESNTKREVSNDLKFNLSKKEVSSTLRLTKIVKPSMMIGLILYLVFLFSSLNIANIQGYTIITHFISELGSLSANKLPFLFDYSSVIGGVTTIFFYPYFSRKINLLQDNEIISQISSYAIFFGVFGSIGTIFVGIFSLERAFGLCHNIFSLFAFVGFTCSLLLFGFIILRFNTGIPKTIGFLSIVPSIIFILHFILLIPLLEWLLLFSILFALIPLFLWITFN